jgi:hypothetical protein
MNNPIEDQRFLNEFEMQIRPTSKRYRRIPRSYQLNYNPWQGEISDAAFYQSTDIEEVECVNVTVPVDTLNHMIRVYRHYEKLETVYAQERDIVAQLREDERVVSANPVVADAYHAYQTLLNLLRHR